MPGDRRHQQPRRQHGPRCGARRVDLPAPPAQGGQRAGEHGQPQHGADRGRQPQAHGQTGQRGVVGGVGHGLGEADPEPLQPAGRTRDEHAEQCGCGGGAEPGGRRPPPAQHQREQQQRAERGLERHGDAVARGREQRVAAALGDPAGRQPDEQQPVDLPEQQSAVQRRRREHHQHDRGGDPGRQPQLAGHHQDGADHHEQAQHREEPVGRQRVQQGERGEQHREQGRVEVPQLGGGVVDVAALDEREGRGPERVEVRVQLVHVR